MRRRIPTYRDDLNTFNFRPVGQGLFYTGSLLHGCCNFVFDCGTESKQKYIKEQIDDFIAPMGATKNNKPVIEFVVISHLHYDHFSGLHYLLQKCDVNKIFLPYLGKNEIVKRTALTLAVYCDSYESEQEDNDGERELTLNLMGGLYGLEGFRDFSEYRDRVVFINEEPDAEEREIDGRNYSTKTIKLGGLRDYWRFNFIQSYAKIEDLELLRKKIKDTFGSKSNMELIELFNISKENIKIMKGIYESVFGKGNLLNLTSIVLVHFPLYRKINRINPFEYTTKQYVFELRYQNIIDHAGCSDVCIASVLTGDAMIDGYMPKEIRTALDKKEILVLQIPHHGSKENWISVKNSGIMGKTNILSFGYGNRHKHPHVSTIDDVINSDINYCLVTQDRSFMYTIE